MRIFGAAIHPITVSAKSRRVLYAVLFFGLLLRVVSMFVIPLTDSSEARYGEIARKMVETGDWITPQFDYGVPFWAKPPLSTWLSALSIKVLGANELGARLPSLLLCIAILALAWQWINKLRGRDQALLTVALLTSTTLFFAAAGAVMTDASLALCTTLTMIAFWNALHGHGRSWGYLFFVGLGVGLLAKGPLVGLLTFLPITVWLIARQEWMNAWRKIPWFTGSLLMFAIALPWYIVEEIKTPGFLAYFIIGEHINRFLHPGWGGDKYGNAHAELLGTIWLYWFYAAFPFSLIAVAWLVKHVKSLRTLFADSDGWALYLLLWAIMPMCFFTFAGNIIWPYVLPALPAFAVLAIELYRRQRNSTDSWSAKGLLTACSVVLFAGTIFTLLYATGFTQHVKSSQRDLVQLWEKLRGSDDSLLVYYGRNYQSALFYSNGKARTATTMAQLDALLLNTSDDFIAVPDNLLDTLDTSVKMQFCVIGYFKHELLLAEQRCALATSNQPIASLTQ